jgi:hypothetical protein
MSKPGLVRNQALASVLCAMASAACVTIPESDPSPPVVTLEVTVDEWPPLGITRHYKVDSGLGWNATDTLALLDFERLHAVATADDTGGVFDIQVHAVLEQVCEPGEPAERTFERENADSFKSPNDTASRGRITYLDVEKPLDFPECPSGSNPQGTVFVRVWAVGSNFHGGVTTSPSVSLMLQR